MCCDFFLPYVQYVDVCVCSTYLLVVAGNAAEVAVELVGALRRALRYTLLSFLLVVW